MGCSRIYLSGFVNRSATGYPGRACCWLDRTAFERAESRTPSGQLVRCPSTKTFPVQLSKLAVMSVDVFIVAILLWFWCYDLPTDSPQRRLVGYIQKPFLYLGLWHGWAMFAPEPLHVNRRLKAIIQYADGSIESGDRSNRSRQTGSSICCGSDILSFSFLCSPGPTQCCGRPCVNGSCGWRNWMACRLCRFSSSANIKP